MPLASMNARSAAHSSPNDSVSVRATTSPAGCAPCRSGSRRTTPAGTRRSRARWTRCAIRGSSTRIGRRGRRSARSPDRPRGTGPPPRAPSTAARRRRRRWCARTAAGCARAALELGAPEQRASAWRWTVSSRTVSRNQRRPSWDSRRTRRLRSCQARSAKQARIARLMTGCSRGSRPDGDHGLLERSRSSGCTSSTSG
jgi:hypothetical protein